MDFSNFVVSFGWEDRIFWWFKDYGASNGEDPMVPRMEVHNPESKDRPAIFFAPSIVFDNPLVMSRILPSGPTISYRLPPDIISLENPSPTRSRKILDSIYEHAVRKAEDSGVSKDMLSIGASFGAAHAIRFAVEHGAFGLEMITAADDLPDSIANGLVTKPLYEKALKEQGLQHQNFVDALDVYSPKKYAEKIPSRTVVYLGSSDRTIPYRGGLRLVDQMRAFGNDPRIHIRRFAGHWTVIRLFNRKEEF
jgi:hypothetical protein